MKSLVPPVIKPSEGASVLSEVLGAQTLVTIEYYIFNVYNCKCHNFE